MNVSYFNIDVNMAGTKYRTYSKSDTCCKVLQWFEDYAIVRMSNGIIRRLSIDNLYDNSYPQWQSEEAALEWYEKHKPL